MMALGNDDIYEQLTDEECDMEMFDDVSNWEMLKPYLYAFLFTIGVIAPWCIGWAMMIKWFVF